MISTFQLTFSSNTTHLQLAVRRRLGPELLNDLRVEGGAAAADHLHLGEVLLPRDVGVDGHHRHQRGHHVEVSGLMFGQTEVQSQTSNLGNTQTWR